MHDKTKRGLELLRSEIMSNKYKRGTIFPSEYALMSRLNLGRGAVRAILKILRDEQLISTTSRGKCSTSQFCDVAREDKSRLLFLTNNEMTFCNDDIYDARYYGIKSRCEELGYTIDNFYHGDWENLNLVDFIRKNKYYGVVGIVGNNRKQLNALLDAEIPCVISGSEIGDDLPCSTLDFREIGRMAGRWLVAHHRKRFATLTGELNTWMYSEMLAGFRGALAEDNFYLSGENIISFQQQQTKNVYSMHYNNIFESLKKVEPDAIFTMRDYRASFVYAYALHEKLTLPDDLSIISFDNHSWDAATAVKLTSINEPLMELGIEAINLIHEWITSGVRPTNKITHGTLVER